MKIKEASSLLFYKPLFDQSASHTSGGLNKLSQALFSTFAIRGTKVSFEAFHCLPFVQETGMNNKLVTTGNSSSTCPNSLNLERFMRPTQNV